MSGHVRQEFTVLTALSVATGASRRLATVALGGLVLVPSGLLLAGPAFADSATPTVGIGDPAYVEATPDPVTGLYPGQAAPATDTTPATGGWIIGGTVSEDAPQGVTPAAPKPVGPKPVAAKPVTVKPVTRPVVVVGPVPARHQAPAVTGQPTVLPFTGPSRLPLQLGLGGGLIVLGALVVVAAGPRGSALHP